MTPISDVLLCIIMTPACRPARSLSALQPCARELLSSFNYVYNQVGVNIFHAKKMMRI